MAGKGFMWIPWGQMLIWRMKNWAGSKFDVWVELDERIGTWNEEAGQFTVLGEHSCHQLSSPVLITLPENTPDFYTHHFTMPTSLLMLAVHRELYPFKFVRMLLYNNIVILVSVAIHFTEVEQSTRPLLLYLCITLFLLHGYSTTNSYW